MANSHQRKEEKGGGNNVREKRGKRIRRERRERIRREREVKGLEGKGREKD